MKEKEAGNEELPQERDVEVKEMEYNEELPGGSVRLR